MNKFFHKKYYVVIFALLLFFPTKVFALEVKANVVNTIKSTMTLDGHNIPTNPATGVQGIGSVCVEMHLSTNKTNPWAPGAYLELDNLSNGYKSINYMSGPNGSRTSQSEWIENEGGGHFPGGALGYMTPKQELWYMNMRWEYVDWYSTSSGTHTRNVDWESLKWHQKHRKVLVTNLKTGLQAIGYIGDSGPGLNLGSPAGNRIAGLSPDLMYYLSNQQEFPNIPITSFGRDDKTDYSFEWVVDQSLPVGPIIAKDGVNLPLKIIKSEPQQKKKELKSTNKTKTKKDISENENFGYGTIIVNFEKTSFVGEWTEDSKPFLNQGEVYPVLEKVDNWYKIYIATTKTFGWVSGEFVSPVTK